MQRNLVIALGLAQHNDPHYYQTLFTKYEQVTPQDIQRVAKQYLPDNKVVLVVEPVAKAKQRAQPCKADRCPPPRRRQARGATARLPVPIGA